MAPSCTVSVGALDFGSIDVSVVNPVDTETTIDVTCTDAAPYSVTLGPGGGGDVTDPRAREMWNGTSFLTYGLYKDPGRTAAWGWMNGENY